MVTLDYSREIKPEDTTLILLVLNAAHYIKDNQFSIIFNQLSMEAESALKGTRDLLDVLMPASLRAHTNSILYGPLNSEWINKSNKWDKLPPQLSNEIKTAPSFSRIKAMH